MKVEARHYEKKNNHVQCHLCPHECSITQGNDGLCRARHNEDGTLWAINYGEVTSVAMDPIEKKPLYHFYPGSRILSIACNSCNMRCPFCQNWEISQCKVETQFLSPEILVKMFKEHPSVGIAYTYTEPLVWFEYLLAAGELIRKEGGKNVLVTNGLINEHPLTELLPLIDAMNIDLKTMNADVYSKVLHGDLMAVKRTIETAHKHCHVEITNLLVTGLNDTKKDIDAVIDYVASVGTDIPLHFSRYYPNYKYDKQPTSLKKLEYAFAQAQKKMDYVYLGNTFGDEGAHTYCPQCDNLLVERMNFKSVVVGLKGTACAVCGATIAIVV